MALDPGSAALPGHERLRGSVPARPRRLGGGPPPGRTVRVPGGLRGGLSGTPGGPRRSLVLRYVPALSPVGGPPYRVRTGTAVAGPGPLADAHPRHRHPHPHEPLPVRRGRHARARVGGARRDQPQRRLPDPQQRPRREPHRAVAHARAVQRGAVGGAEVGDRDAAAGGDGDRAVRPGDVGVVERDVGVGGAADADLAAVQQVDAARVRARDHLELGRGVRGPGCGSGSPGAPRNSTAPSVRGGSPRVHRRASSGRSPAYSTTGPEPSPPGTAAARADATSASAVPTGAVTSTSRLAARPGAGEEDGPSGSTTVSRICIAAAVPSARAPARPRTKPSRGPPPRTSPTATRARRPVLHASHLPRWPAGWCGS
ncbi:hypothetical protein SFUMM280S_09481 [Streptomyces fumanus]